MFLQPRERVDGLCAVREQLEVQVRAERATGVSDLADRVANLDLLAVDHLQRADLHVRVVARDALPVDDVIDVDVHAIRAARGTEAHRAVGDGLDLRAGKTGWSQCRFQELYVGVPF